MDCNRSLLCPLRKIGVTTWWCPSGTDVSISTIYTEIEFVTCPDVATFSSPKEKDILFFSPLPSTPSLYRIQLHFISSSCSFTTIGRNITICTNPPTPCPMAPAKFPERISCRRFSDMNGWELNLALAKLRTMLLHYRER